MVKLVHLFEPQFHHLWGGDNDMWGLKETIYREHEASLQLPWGPSPIISKIGCNYISSCFFIYVWWMLKTFHRVKARVLLPIPIRYYKSPINLGEHVVGNWKLKLYGLDFREHSHVLLKTSRNSSCLLGSLCLSRLARHRFPNSERNAWLPFLQPGRKEEARGCWRRWPLA